MFPAVPNTATRPSVVAGRPPNDPRWNRRVFPMVLPRTDRESIDSIGREPIDALWLLGSHEKCHPFPLQATVPKNQAQRAEQKYPPNPVTASVPMRW